jgi:hypothetical protein
MHPETIILICVDLECMRYYLGRDLQLFETTEHAIRKMPSREVLIKYCGILQNYRYLISTFLNYLYYV